MGAQYWSEEFTQTNSDISIIHGGIDLHVTEQFKELSGANVYLFSEEGSYLNRSATTDKYGNAPFTVPEGSYILRVDANDEQHWSEVVHVIAYQNSQVEIEIGEILSTNNPRPIRFDGKPPVYRPMLASIGSLDGLFTRSVVEEPRTYYFISDHLGTGQLLVNQEQQVVWQTDYSPFGQVDVVVDRVSNSFRFPGQYFDQETGLHYNWHRFYDPETGRYISADPIGLTGGINLYGYVGGDPVNKIDPKGLAWDGNLTPGSGDQDNVCSPPAGIFNRNKCTKKCCKEHDDCYKKYHCNATSWIPTAVGAYGLCNYCNLRAMQCIMNNIGEDDCDDCE